jgi:hypothetical protein
MSHSDMPSSELEELKNMLGPLLSELGSLSISIGLSLVDPIYKVQVIILIGNQ